MPTLTVNYTAVENPLKKIKAQRPKTQMIMGQQNIHKVTSQNETLQ